MPTFSQHSVSLRAGVLPQRKKSRLKSGQKSGNVQCNPLKFFFIKVPTQQPSGQQKNKIKYNYKTMVIK
jgi:hypothetical protein